MFFYVLFYWTFPLNHHQHHESNPIHTAPPILLRLAPVTVFIVVSSSLHLKTPSNVMINASLNCTSLSSGTITSILKALRASANRSIKKLLKAPPPVARSRALDIGCLRIIVEC